MSLRTCVIEAIMKNVLEPAKKSSSWNVLIMDERATRIISHVFRMQDITENNITLVESLYRRRKPLKMSAIYLMRPNWREVSLLIEDFNYDIPKYPSAHVFFLLPCPQDILQKLSSSRCVRFLKTLSQLDLDFVTIESSLFSFESRDAGYSYSLPDRFVPDKPNRLNQMADQLTTVCVTLGERPRICYRRTDSNLELARLLQAKLDASSKDNPQLGKGLHKDRSVLLILDRGVDPASPVLHELTVQAMLYDLQQVEENVYTYGDNKKMDVTDQEPMWSSVRHKHIAEVMKDWPQRIREFAEKNKQFMDFQQQQKLTKASADDAPNISIRELAMMVKQLPQHNNEASILAGVNSVIVNCMDIFRRGYANVCNVEQDMVMGQTAEGEVVQDPMRALIELFKLDFTTTEDRLRLLLLFVLMKDGLSEGHLTKLLETAQVDISQKALFASFCLLCNAQLIIPDPTSDHLPPTAMNFKFGQCDWYTRLPKLASVSDQVKVFLPVKKKRKNRVDSDCYTFSRWSPFLQDIIESIIQGQLPNPSFTYLMGSNVNSRPVDSKPNDTPGGTKEFKGPSARFHASGAGSATATTSAQAPKGISSFGDRNLGAGDHCGPRLIVFFTGGVTWSEVRTACQVTQKCLETRVAESDRHSTGQQNAALLTGGGGVGWNWTVVIGSTHIVTPVSFLGDLESMSAVMLSGPASSSAGHGAHIQGHTNPSFQRT